MSAIIIPFPTRPLRPTPPTDQLDQLLAVGRSLMTRVDEDLLDRWLGAMDAWARTAEKAGGNKPI